VRLLSVAVALFCALLLVAGCVGKSTYQAKVDEAARLAERVQGLEAESRELSRQKAELTGRNDALSGELTEAKNRVSTLEEDLQRARADLDRLEEVLSARGEEAGRVMAAMRQTIDRLEAENRELARQIEAERAARAARLAEIQGTYDELVRKMEAEIQRGEITISELQGKLTVNMVERILFDSGKADIKPAGLEVLRRVGDSLKGVEDKEVRVEGHTDDVPISPRLQATFPTNWELAAARATNVVRFLKEKVGIAGERLSACGFGEYRPVADDATEEGRAQNRRIQIVLVPLEGKPGRP
jgi:chemotaxis protein MotB